MESIITSMARVQDRRFFLENILILTSEVALKDFVCEL